MGPCAGMRCKGGAADRLILGKLPGSGDAETHPDGSRANGAGRAPPAEGQPAKPAF